MANSSFVLHASIGGLVVKLAVAIRDHGSQMIRPAPGSIPGRCSNGWDGADLLSFAARRWV